MRELVLLAEYPTRESAKSRVMELIAVLGKSPTVQRTGDGWGVYVGKEHAAKLSEGNRSSGPAATDPPSRSSSRAPATRTAKAIQSPPSPERLSAEKESGRVRGAKAAPASSRTLSAPRTRSQVGSAVGTQSSGRDNRRPQEAQDAELVATKKAARSATKRAGTWSMSQAEARKMATELRHAFGQLSADEVSGWVGRTVQTFGLVSARRVANLAGLAINLTEGFGDEILGLTKAILENRTTTHIGSRLRTISTRAKNFVSDARVKATPVIADLRRNPTEVAPDLLVMAFVAYASSGGFDGDGGIPDSDIALLGIEAHRSIFTHSIVAGAVIETSLYALIDFVGIAYQHLPPRQDRRWMIIHDRLQRAAVSGARGTSMGLAYHLGVDGIVQPGAYHDLPFTMPMEGHQAVLTANAAAEGLDINKKASPNAHPVNSTVVRRDVPASSRGSGENRALSILTGAAGLAALLLGFG